MDFFLSLAIRDGSYLSKTGDCPWQVLRNGLDLGQIIVPILTNDLASEAEGSQGKCSLFAYWIASNYKIFNITIHLFDPIKFYLGLLIDEEDCYQISLCMWGCSCLSEVLNMQD